MQTLQQYMLESLINEAFQSDIMRNFWMGLQKYVRNHGGWRSWSVLQWDKIKDEDLKRLEKDEALKRMRSQKNPGYLLWVDDTKPKTKYGYGDKPNEQYQYNGITYGWDVVMTYDGCYRDVKANHIADSATFAYEVIDPSRFFCSQLQQARREAREGALALADPERIRDENLERYKKALAKMRTPDAEDLVPKFEEIAEMYKKVFDKYVAAFCQKMQEDSPSYIFIGNQLTKLNELFTNLTANMASIKNHKKGQPDWAQRSFREFNMHVSKIENYINDYLSKVE